MENDNNNIPTANSDHGAAAPNRSLPGRPVVQPPTQAASIAAAPAGRPPRGDGWRSDDHIGERKRMIKRM